MIRAEQGGADIVPTGEGMQRLREALAECSSETQRLVPQPVLEIPAVSHMLTVFLSDTSRYRCRPEMVGGWIADEGSAAMLRRRVTGAADL